MGFPLWWNFIREFCTQKPPDLLFLVFGCNFLRLLIIFWTIKKKQFQFINKSHSWIDEEIVSETITRKYVGIPQGMRDLNDEGLGNNHHHLWLVFNCLLWDRFLINQVRVSITIFRSSKSHFQIVSRQSLSLEYGQ